ncbi:protein serine/threonine phosphatase 2C [Neoconidiobolus thromboides FSU 785]|nr:protein serine/threonine phosphatase 2C [Neoconidiobolus thromboides FSU 785]
MVDYHGQATSLIGNRESQQDDYLIDNNVFGDKSYALYAVFDGHGKDGAKASKGAKKRLKELISRRKEAFIKDPRTTLHNLFQDIGELLEEDVQMDLYMSGTTAVVVVLNEIEIWVANLGDCRAILGRTLKKEASTSYKCVVLTRDHTCSDIEERNRVEKLGARVAVSPDHNAPDAPFRLYKGTLPYPGLVMTRAFGDVSAKKVGLIWEPEIFHYKITADDKALILATDGVWDALPNEKVIQIACKYSNEAEASENLANKSLKYLGKKQIDDNVTNIVIFLK